LPHAPRLSPSRTRTSPFYEDEGHERQKERVKQALASDPDYAPAVALHGIQFAREGDTAAGIAWINRALVLDPTEIDVLWYAAELLIALERSAVDITEYVVSVDPVNAEARLQLAWAYYFSGQPDKALAAARAAYALSPRTFLAHYVAGNILLEKGELAQALAEAEQETGEEARLELLSSVYHLMGETDHSDARLNELIEKYEKEDPQIVALALARRGETDRAFEYLDKAAALPSRPWFPTSTEFSPISADPRWAAFLEKVGRAPHQVAGVTIDYTLPQ
jgi:tetratricopeptide (TPR) repeat protein